MDIKEIKTRLENINAKIISSGNKFELSFNDFMIKTDNIIEELTILIKEFDD